MMTEDRPPVEEVLHRGTLLAIILRSAYREPGIHFFTPNTFSQQLGFMRHPVGKIIDPHVHNHICREITYTQEVLFIRRGRLRVDFYSSDRDYLRSYVLEGGDVVLLASGGHGFEVLEEVEMIEVKQGPYTGDADKTRFDGVSSGRVSFGFKGEI